MTDGGPENQERAPHRWPHVALLVALLLAVWPLLDLDGVFSTDEGSYATQARALRDGGWDIGYPFAEADPALQFVPYHGTVVDDGHAFAYVSHPLWPAALAGSSALVGEEAGLRALGVASIVVLALCAWSIAVEIGARGAAPVAFWIAAASPALANAWIAWAHAPAAAAGALLALGVLRARRRPAWLIVVVVAAAAGVLLRSEGVLWAAAVGAVTLALGLRRRERSMLVAGGVTALATVVTLVGERAWVVSIAGDGVETGLRRRDGGAGLLDRVEAGRVALLDGAIASDLGRVLGLLAAVGVALAAVGLCRQRWEQLVMPGLVAGAVASLLRTLVAGDDPATGLLAAAPLLVLAAAAVPLVRQRQEAGPVVLGWAAVVFMLAVLATQYADGGALQWGGRFFAPALGPLAALAAVAVAPLWSTLPSTAGRRHRLQPIVLAVGAIVVVQAAGAIVVPDRLRRSNEEAIDRVIALGPSVLVASDGQIARLDRRGWPDRCWASVDTVADLRAVISVLVDSGAASAAYAGFPTGDLAANDVAHEPDREGRPIGVLTLPEPDTPRLISEPYTCR